MPDRPPENPAQPEHIRRSGTASSIFQPKAMPSKSGRSVRRPSLRRREGCRRPRPKQTAYHPPEARREAPCPPPHSRPAAKKRRTEEVVGSAEASYVPAGGRTAHSSGHRRRTIACRCSPATRQRDFRPDQRSRIPSSGRHETTDGPGSAQSGNIAIFILRNRLCSVQIAARCGIGEVVSPEEALSGKSTGTPAIAARLPRTSARHRHVSTCRPPEGTFEAVRIGPDDNSAGSPPTDRPVPHSQAGQTPLSASVTFRDTTDVPSVLSPNTGFRRQANGAPPRPSPRANESRRSEKRALLHPTRFRSKAAHSRRRLRPPGGSGSVSNRAKKQIEAARSVSSTAVEVPSEHAYSAASCNLEWQTTKTRQANESFAAASGEPLIRGKYENCNDRKEAV